MSGWERGGACELEAEEGEERSSWPFSIWESHWSKSGASLSELIDEAILRVKKIKLRWGDGGCWKQSKGVLILIERHT